jgi:hypothetical protein
MNILVVKPKENNTYKDDTSMFCDGLRKLGHNIIESHSYYKDGYIMNYDVLTKQDLNTIDIAWAPYEPLIPVISYLKSQNPNIRTVGHFELIPPYKINIETINEYAINGTAFPKNNGMIKNYFDYKLYINEWLKCDFKTYIADSMLVEMERLLGKRIDRQRIAIKPYPLDNEMLEMYRDDNIVTKYQILCSVRLVAHKKIHHIIKALSIVNNPPNRGRTVSRFIKGICRKVKGKCRIYGISYR